MGRRCCCEGEPSASGSGQTCHDCTLPPSAHVTIGTAEFHQGSAAFCDWITGRRFKLTQPFGCGWQGCFETGLAAPPRVHIDAVLQPVDVVIGGTHYFYQWSINVFTANADCVFGADADGQFSFLSADPPCSGAIVADNVGNTAGGRQCDYTDSALLEIP